jgi:hypothetical protein
MLCIVKQKDLTVVVAKHSEPPTGSRVGTISKRVGGMRLVSRISEF